MKKIVAYALLLGAAVMMMHCTSHNKTASNDEQRIDSLIAQLTLAAGLELSRVPGRKP